MDNIKADAMEHEAKLNEKYTLCQAKQILCIKERPISLFLMDNIKMDRIPAKIK